MSTISGVSGSGDAWAAMKAQRSQMQAKMFAKVDTDSSGGVDKTELQGLLTDVAQKTGVTNDSSSSDELFSKMDSNSDGSLSSDELDQGMQSLMPPPPSTMDFAQSRSDSTSNEETRGADGTPPPPPPGGAGGSASAGSTTYDPLDTNEDGTVSAQERLAGSSSSSSTDAVQTLLKAIDTNDDKQISSDETDAFMEKLTAQLEGTDSSATSTQNSVDLAELVKQAYEQIMTQQTKGGTLSALA
ncbi:EF-hand domain-containing protein [Rhodoferax ferrireducens]|uniref:EF-hand domain-containing protein n=1 Tax=Rhodoferax ferrireducens TaxID=192843 RepID=UPI000E0D268F|nr:EF-hand domain-containing protein [Rhodoferax ferrireducens]